MKRPNWHDGRADDATGGGMMEKVLLEGAAQDLFFFFFFLRLSDRLWQHGTGRPEVFQSIGKAL